MLTVKKFCVEFDLSLSDYIKACNTAKLNFGGNPQAPITGRELEAVYNYAKKWKINFNFRKFHFNTEILGKRLFEKNVFFVLKQKENNEDLPKNTELPSSIDKQFDYKSKIAGMERKGSPVISVPIGGQTKFKRR